VQAMSGDQDGLNCQRQCRRWVETRTAWIVSDSAGNEWRPGRPELSATVQAMLLK